MTLVQEEVVVLQPPPIEETSPMKPSELLRLASLTGLKQTRGTLYNAEAYCAFGAIARMAGGPAYGEGRCSVSGKGMMFAMTTMPSDIREMVFALNDDKHLTFNEIADFLENFGY